MSDSSAPTEPPTFPAPRLTFSLSVSVAVASLAVFSLFGVLMYVCFSTGLRCHDWGPGEHMHRVTAKGRGGRTISRPYAQFELAATARPIEIRDAGNPSVRVEAAAGNLLLHVCATAALYLRGPDGRAIYPNPLGEELGILHGTLVLPTSGRGAYQVCRVADDSSVASIQIV